MSDLETRRADNRAAMPATARLFDEVTAVFGPGCKILYATENGHTVGNPVHQHRRRGIDWIDGTPCTPKHESFHSLLLEEFVRKTQRLPRMPNDPAWRTYVAEQTAKRFDSYQPR